MQEQPIEQELQEIKRRLTRLERHTEPIQITRLEIESGSLYRRMDDVQEATNSTQTKMDSVREDVLKIRESQADLRDRLREQSDDLKVIKEKQEAHTELLGQLIGIGESHTKSLESHTKSLERIEATMATKDDIKNMATKDDISALKGDISRIEKVLHQILEKFQGE